MPAFEPLLAKNVSAPSKAPSVLFSFIAEIAPKVVRVVPAASNLPRKYIPEPAVPEL